MVAELLPFCMDGFRPTSRVTAGSGRLKRIINRTPLNRFLAEHNTTLSENEGAAMRSTVAAVLLSIITGFSPLAATL